LSFDRDGIYIAGPDVTIDLNGYAIFYGVNSTSEAHGIHLYLNWADSDRDAISDSSEAFRAKIINGAIVYAGPKGAQPYKCHAIYGYRGNEAVIDNCRLEVSGTDSSGVFFRWGSSTVSNSFVNNLCTATADRHTQPGSLNVGGGSYVHHNILIGGNLAVNVVENCRVEYNFISHNSYATNGYGIGEYRSNGSTFQNNLIVPLNGRGIMLNAGEGNKVLSNVILAWDSPNEEYGWGLNAAGIRMRYECKNNLVKGNTILALGGGDRCSASGLYFGNYEFQNTITENTSYSILSGDTTHDQRANAITLEDQGKPGNNIGATDLINSNKFISNNVIISISGGDSCCYQLTPLVGNQCDWLGAQPAFAQWSGAAVTWINNNFPDSQIVRDRWREIVTVVASKIMFSDDSYRKVSVYTGYWGVKEVITILDTISTSGVTFDLGTITAENLRDSPRSIKIGTSKTLTCSTNVAGKSGTIRFSAGPGAFQDLETYPFTVDSAGKTTVPVISYALDKLSGTGIPFNRVNRITAVLSIPGFSDIIVPVANIPSTLAFSPV